MKERADALLVSRGLCDSREQAKRLILAGEVRTSDAIVSKPSSMLPLDCFLEVKEKLKYVGRGGLKLEGALAHFSFDVNNLTCIDIGASTGGFTDCLLQSGAAKVHAVDVGTNQLAWKIRNDSRVIVKEKFNARHMEVADIGESVDLAVIDVSFISLTKILPAAFRVLKEKGKIICLIKPQFELEKNDIGKGGIVRDASLHERAVMKIKDCVTEELAQTFHSVMDSPITGTDGNKEFLALLEKSPHSKT